MTNYVLIHNPMFGPSMWMPTAEALAKRGHNIALPALGPVLAGEGPYYPKLGQAIADTAKGMKDGVVIVGLNAGATLTGVAAGAAQVPVRAVIFCESILPHPNRSWFSTVPAEVRSGFVAAATDGRVPKSHEWSEELPAELRQRVGNDAIYNALLKEMVAVPIAYFDEVAPANDPFRGMRIGYLQLSTLSQEHYDNAVWMKWKTRQELSTHEFPTVTNANRVAAALEALTNEVLA